MLAKLIEILRIICSTVLPIHRSCLAYLMCVKVLFLKMKIAIHKFAFYSLPSTSKSRVILIHSLQLSYVPPLVCSRFFIRGKPFFTCCSTVLVVLFLKNLALFFEKLQTQGWGGKQNKTKTDKVLRQSKYFVSNDSWRSLVIRQWQYQERKLWNQVNVPSNSSSLWYVSWLMAIIYEFECFHQSCSFKGKRT